MSNFTLEGLNAVTKLAFLVFIPFKYVTVLGALFGIEYRRRDYLQESGSFALTALGGIMYLVRFIQWYQQKKQMKTVDRETVPPAPLVFHPNENKGIEDRLDVCGLCLKQPNKPAAIPTGRVYCLSCIKNFVAKHSKCPASGIEIGMNDIIPLLL